MTLRSPVIGLTGIHFEVGEEWGGPYPALFCETAYMDAILACGALPIMIPAEAARVLDIIDTVDALVLTGGPDISPERYGQSPEADIGAVDPIRDEFELALIDAAFPIGTPILGICRGAQMLNVGLGGSLVQHITGHSCVAEASEQTHSITIRPGSKLHSVLGNTTINVNSLHHQTMSTLGRGLTISAWASRLRAGAGRRYRSRRSR